MFMLISITLILIQGHRGLPEGKQISVELSLQFWPGGTRSDFPEGGVGGVSYMGQGRGGGRDAHRGPLGSR